MNTYYMPDTPPDSGNKSGEYNHIHTMKVNLEII